MVHWTEGCARYAAVVRFSMPNNSTPVRSIQRKTLESIPVEDRLGLAVACFVNAYAPCIGILRNRQAGQLITLNSSCNILTHDS